MMKQSAPAPSDRSAGGTRKRLLAACEILIGRDGFAAISARRLAEEARTNLAMTSYHFGGVAGLLHCVADNNLDRTAGDALHAMQNQAGDGRERLSGMTQAMIRSLWAPAVHSGTSRSSFVVEEIYAQGSEAVRNALSGKLRDLFVEMVELYAPLVPHLTRNELTLRLTCIGGAIRSMSERSTAWSIYFDAAGETTDEDGSLIRSVSSFALAALEVE